VMWEVPVGSVRTDDNRLEKSADRQVQQAAPGASARCVHWGGSRGLLAVPYTGVCQVGIVATRG
jgi:hypothetical protein